MEEAIENTLILLDFFRSVYRPGSVLDRDREAFGFPTAAIDKAPTAAPIQLGNVAPISEENVVSWMTYLLVEHWVSYIKDSLLILLVYRTVGDSETIEGI